jgi:hypothetical protein
LGRPVFHGRFVHHRGGAPFKGVADKRVSVGVQAAQREVQITRLDFTRIIVPAGNVFLH